MQRTALVVFVMIVLTACSSGAGVSSPTAGATLPSAQPTVAAPVARSAAPAATPVGSAVIASTPTAAATFISTASPGATVGASPSAAASLCVDTQSTGTGDRSVGTVKGTVSNGRILIGIEAAAGPSGTFALAYIDSSGLHEIPSVADWTTAHPTWESSTSIVFDSERADDRHLFRANVADGSITQITDTFRIGEQSADILGDGRIVHDMYSCSDPTDLGLNVTTADGSTTTDLTPALASGDPGYDTEAAVAPDGHTIAFVRHINENTGALFTIDASGGTATRLMPDADHVSYPRWSPDGKAILFTQNFPSGATDLWTIPPAAGASPKRVTQSDPGATRFEADWSPDGKQIVFKYFQQGWTYNELHLADADGSNETVLWTGDNSTAETPHWGP